MPRQQVSALCGVRLMVLVLLVLVALAAPAAAHADTDAQAPADSAAAVSDPAGASGERDEASAISGAVSLYVNFVPDLTFLMPLFAMTRGRLYVEVRYQYENLATASLWGGPSFGGGGDEFSWWIAPVGGVVFGRTNGLSPGLDVALEWRRLSFSTSAQYVFDLEDEDASFFYSWSEWIYSAHELCAPGITVERSRVRGEDRDINLGLTAYSHIRGLSFSFYAFNVWDTETDYYVGGVGYEF